MQKLIVNGGRKLYGEVKISPAKNACLPIIASSLLIDGRIGINPCPLIDDVIVMAEIVKELGGSYTFNRGELLLDLSGVSKYEGGCKTYSRARASFFTAGAIISRFGRAVIPLPGGCNIGNRPVDIHLDVFRQLNIICKQVDGCVHFDGRSKRSGCVKLKYPSVGATVNAINASVYTKGQTIISNCAKEPEIKDLCNFLNRCGCKILGGGSHTIVIEGVNPIGLSRVIYSPIYDRIEAGTYMMAVATCGGELVFECADQEPILATCKVLKRSGVKIEYNGNNVKLYSTKTSKRMKVSADVYPAFPTDMQPQLVAYLSTAEGKSLVRDRVFPNRFAYLKQLERFGCAYKLDGNSVSIFGAKGLNPAYVKATDLRGGAALLILALKAEGVSEIGNLDVLDRGYERLQEKLNDIGACVKRI